jgi:hypothetical protein
MPMGRGRRDHQPRIGSGCAKALDRLQWKLPGGRYLHPVAKEIVKRTGASVPTCSATSKVKAGILPAEAARGPESSGRCLKSAEIQ